jgi:hypothetical protein
MSVKRPLKVSPPRSGLASLSKAVSKAMTGLDPLISAISLKTPSISPLSLLKAEFPFYGS